MRESTRVVAAVVFLIVLACHSIGRALYDAGRFLAKQTDSETVCYIKTVGPLIPEIPKDVVVGYVSDFDPNSGEYYRVYYTVRYILSPTRVIWKTDSEWMIAMFRSRAKFDQFVSDGDYEIVKVSDRGAVLLRKKAR